MSQKEVYKSAFRIFIAILAFISFSIFMLFKLSKTTLFSPYECKMWAVFETGEGIEKGSPVFFKGVEIGRIVDKKLIFGNNPKVLIEFVIDKRIKNLLREDAFLLNISKFLTPSKLVLHCGISERHLKSDTIKGKSLKAVEESIDRLNTILVKIDTILSSDLKIAKASADTMIREIREFMKKTKEAFEKVEKSKFAEVLNNDTLMTKVFNAVDNINKLANSLKEDSLYQNTLKLIKDTRELIEDIKRHPKKYFKVF